MSRPGPGKGKGNSGNRQGAGGGGSRPVAGSQNRAGSTGGAPSRRPSTQIPNSAGASRGGANHSPATRGGATPPPSGLKGQLDSALPPFSVRRYVAIWAAIMIPLGILFIALLALRPATTGNGGTNSAAANVSGTALSAATTINGTAPSAAVTVTGTVTAPGLAGAGGNCQAPNAAGKYMVVDTDKGCIVAKLYTDATANVPKTIANFEQKANANFFNGLIFHRVENWVIQGGDPAGTGSGGGKMPSEYNALPFKAGALGVARGPDKSQNSDSQFFITKSAADYLNGEYTNFGEVVQGMDVVNKIAIGDKMNKVTVTDRK